MTLSRTDILSIVDFTAQRPRLEAEVIAAKQSRRVLVGEHMMFLFENHLTIQWQIQEMARVEGIRTAEGIAHEIETYKALLPTPEQLSATLLIEYPEPGQRDSMLYKLLGLEQHVYLDIAGTAWTSKKTPIQGHGATGVGVRLLVEWLSARSA